MKERSIPVKNYILLLFLSVISVLFIFYISSTYKERQKILNSQNTRMNFLLQVTEENISNYIEDNHDAIIYVSNASDINLETYEKKLKRIFIAKELEQEIVYLNIENVSGDFYNKFKKEYFEEDLINNNYSFDVFPNVLIISDGKVSNILYNDNVEYYNLNATEAVLFIESNYLKDNND